MKHSTGAPTKAERERFAALRELGCICCRMRGLRHWPVEIHHLLSGNRRRGHKFTIPLCDFHHRGQWSLVAKRHQAAQAKDMRELFGPSLAHGSKPFRAAFGSDDELLARVNELLAQRRAA